MNTKLLKRFKLLHLLIALGILVLIGNSGFKSLIKNYLEYRRLENRQLELGREQAELKERLQKVTSGEFTERAARNELGLSRAGEYEYRFPPPGKVEK